MITALRTNSALSFSIAINSVILIRNHTGAGFFERGAEVLVVVIFGIVLSNKPLDR